MKPSNLFKLALFALFTIISHSSAALQSAATTTEVQISTNEGFGSQSKNDTAGKGRILRGRRQRGKACRRNGRDRWRPLLEAQPKPVPPPTEIHWDAVVAQDGSGRYRTIQEALDASSTRAPNKRFVVYIKEGRYNEYLTIGKNQDGITFIGDGIRRTIITGNNNAKQNGENTTLAATVGVLADDFFARDLTFENTAGPENLQAPAINVEARAAFLRVGFEGYQDTLYAHKGIQFYKECEIYGSLDFVFGEATAIIKYSKIILRPSIAPNKTDIPIVAPRREAPVLSGAIVFHRCIFSASYELRANLDKYKIYLGRPCGKFGRAVFIMNDFQVPIQPQGWLLMREEEYPEEGALFGEYGNKGISTNGRVTWKGVRPNMSDGEAKSYIATTLLDSNNQQWFGGLGVHVDDGI